MVSRVTVSRISVVGCMCEAKSATLVSSSSLLVRHPSMGCRVRSRSVSHPTAMRFRCYASSSGSVVSVQVSGSLCAYQSIPSGSSANCGGHFTAITQCDPYGGPAHEACLISRDWTLITTMGAVSPLRRTLGELLFSCLNMLRSGRLDLSMRPARFAGSL